jgi:hypothetical protein
MTTPPSFSALSLESKSHPHALARAPVKVANDPDVYAQVIFLGSGGEGERVPLEVRDLGARKEDVLTSSDGGLFLLDLKFHDLGRVLDDL